MCESEMYPSAYITLSEISYAEDCLGLHVYFKVPPVFNELILVFVGGGGCICMCNEE